ncbi:hypothetical protein HUJ04_006305 [Dendroctonus ponderosae]|nr:hypothetical protein HUJ04_006305 [Dendroctonus ponderosae]
MDEEKAEELRKLNKKILEIKKKIQLSEGQRRALFEDCESERKSNVDEILHLKKEIASLVVVLHESKSSVAKHRLQTSRLENIVGPLSEKTCSEVKKRLDLQIIDKSKKLDLLAYQLKKRRRLLSHLGEEYQRFSSKEEKKELAVKVDQPVYQATREFQNSIHAVEVQIREANHIRHKYGEIRRCLKDDAAKFESRIKSLETELKQQSADTEKLLKILEEATRRRGQARGILLKEERLAAAAANQRDQEAAEGRRLVSERKVELEKLEKRLFLRGRLPARPEPEGAEADVEEEKSETPPHPVELKSQEFELLKRATGGTSTQEVLDKFQAQKQTQNRLNELRNKSEKDKRMIEKQIESLRAKLDEYKYSESRDADKKSGGLERLQLEIAHQHSRSDSYRKETTSRKQALTSVLLNLHGLRSLVNPVAASDETPSGMMAGFVLDVKELVRRYAKYKLLEKPDDDAGRIEHVEANLPTPYSGLIRRTPQPQMMGAPSPGPPPGSEDEEEVPSRSFLKRQAQLVIDAKSRRRNLRIQLPKRN